MIFYVAKNGSDRNSGHKDAPFLTICRAAQAVAPGDTVRVGTGVYREWVSPDIGGLSDTCRVTFEAAPGAHPVIKGSEVIAGFEPISSGVWRKRIPNTLFADGNPFAQPIEGDWLIWPDGHPERDTSGRIPYTYPDAPDFMKARHNACVHTGEVYVNGKAYFEAASLEELCAGQERNLNYGNNAEYVLDTERTKYLWYAVVEETETVLYLNAHAVDPSSALVEVNVRPCCFYPKKTGVNYVTVRGFELCQAASPFAPPTAEQIGMLGAHWSRGWVIEDNVLHDAKCAAVSLGRDGADGHNLYSRYGAKPGYRYQMEAVFRALQSGWRRGIVGGHTVRNNTIFDCGQCGIVGHMGGAFSVIEHNHIFAIGTKREFFGWEIAGIKLHAAVDTVLSGNYIHDCQLGMWLDWQAQGTRVTKNVMAHNYNDLMIEVTHGPLLIDHNVLLSPYNLTNAAQGTAFVHNLFGGASLRYSVLDRATPYHMPHSTDVLGCAVTLSGDDRACLNLYAPASAPLPDWTFGTSGYDACTTKEEYMQRLEQEGNTDEAKFFAVPQPFYARGNAYAQSAHAFRAEKDAMFVGCVKRRILEENGTVYLSLSFSGAMPDAQSAVTASELGMPRITEQPYENPDGSSVDLAVDYTGTTRYNKALPGPFEGLSAGENLIELWHI